MSKNKNDKTEEITAEELDIASDYIKAIEKAKRGTKHVPQIKLAIDNSTNKPL